MSRSDPSIAVLGSINMDLVVRSPALPKPGQTILADSCVECCGGKGANQAVAAARAGGNVALVGRVGDDAFAGRLLANLQRENVDCQWVRSTANCCSGLAIVSVERSGQNSIVVVPGANAHLSVADVDAARSAIESAEILLVQLETPLDAVLAAIEIAVANQVRVVLDPAPVPATCPNKLLGVDLVCPNQSEAAAIVGAPVESVAQAESAAEELHSRGARLVVITLGRQGTLFFDGRASQLVEPYPVTAVDTTAAGDAFAGALSVYWAEGNQLIDTIRFGNAAGALAASRPGAQPSLAVRDQIESFWRSER